MYMHVHVFVCACGMLKQHYEVQIHSKFGPNLLNLSITDFKVQ